MYKLAFLPFALLPFLTSVRGSAPPYWATDGRP